MENKKQKLREMVKNVLKTRNKQSIVDFLNYTMSDDFTTEEEIIESVFYVGYLLRDQEIREKVLNLKEWVIWAKLRKNYTTEDGKNAIGYQGITEGINRIAKEF